MTKHIIIGTTGIGAALAQKLAASGADLHLVSRDQPRLSTLGARLGASFMTADVLLAGELEQAILAGGTEIDGLAYCVGSINLRPATRLTDAEIVKDFELNAVGAFRAIKAALPALKDSQQQTSSILLFSTVAVQQGFASHASVAMAKGAIEGLTRAMAAELAPKIRVNCIAPSLIRTPLSHFITDNEATTKAIAALHPLQRIGETDDVAGMAALLMSAESSWITGQIIGIDGGRSSLRGKG